jgi:hypothetical protein
MDVKGGPSSASHDGPVAERLAEGLTSPCHRHREPEHRIQTFVLLSIWFGGLLALLFGLPDRRNEALGGAVVGLLVAFVFALPERWELDADEFRKVYPNRDAGRIRLAEASALEATPRVKSGFDVWLVGRHGYRVEVPSEPGRKGDAFRAELFQSLPSGALTRVHDSYLLELMARAARAAATQPEWTRD